MNITREVITDLLPIYLSGEASADTQTLVAEFLAADPEFARLINAPNAILPDSSPVFAQDRELATLKATRSVLRQRSYFLAFAIVFSLSAIAIRFSADGLFWLWRDQPFIGAILLTIGVVCAYQYWRISQKLIGSKL